MTPPLSRRQFLRQSPAPLALLPIGLAGVVAASPSVEAETLPGIDPSPIVFDQGRQGFWEVDPIKRTIRLAPRWEVMADDDEPQPEPLLTIVASKAERDGLVSVDRFWEPADVDNCRLCWKCDAHVIGDSHIDMFRFFWRRDRSKPDPESLRGKAYCDRWAPAGITEEDARLAREE